jgi:cyclic-di-GMP phosphodiesterase TipF (flagellum assembly factor)
MTAPETPSPRQAAPKGGLWQSIALIVLAIAIGAGSAALHVILAAPVETAVLAAVASLSALVTVYVLARRSAVIQALDSEINELRAEIATLRARTQRSAAMSQPLAGHDRAQATSPQPARHPSRPPRTIQPSAEAGASQQRASEASHPAASASPGESEATAAPAALSEPAPPLPAAASDTPPAQAAQPDPATPASTEPPLPVTGPLPAMPAPASATAAMVRPPPPPRPTAPAQAHGEPKPAPAPRSAAKEPVSWPRVAPPAAASTLDLPTMRNLIEQLSTRLDPSQQGVPAEKRAVASDAGTSTPAGPATPAPRPARPPATNRREATAPLGHLALVAEAVEARRMEVYLDPILGLSNRKARHFELSLRLRGAAGEDIDPPAYRRTAAGSGLLARIDAAKLAHAADVAERLRTRGAGASLFSTLAGESLADENFLGAFTDLFQAEEGLGAKLVLTFTQSDARAFTPAHWQSLDAMRAIGLGFALEEVTDLDMDFEMLRKHGFGFVKLDAAVFLEGLPIAGGRIPSSDVCRHLAGLGLGLIVGGIVAEKDLARLLGFGVLLGQGTLFGGPRSVEVDRMRRAA